MKNLKTKTEVVSSAETNKPAEIHSDHIVNTPAGPIAVQGEQEQKEFPKDESQSQFMGIADLVKDISDDKVAMAENLGIPIRGILNWAAVIEANVINQGKALQQLGVNLQPVVELAQKVKAQQGAPAGTAGHGELGTIVSLVKEAMGTGQQGMMSEGDRYFMEMGREMASLGSFMAKEMFRKTIPEAMAAWEKTRVAT